MKKAKIISVLTALALIFSVFVCTSAVNAEGSVITLLACSDFQNPGGNAAGTATIRNIISSIKSDGTASADGFLCCGDYDYDLTYREDETESGVNALKDAVKDMVSENMVMIQGNHDSGIGTAGMAPSGDNDPEGGGYGVFVINEDDYMWGNNDEKTVKVTAQSLVEYLNSKLDAGFNKPVFVLSHLPLHYSMRTRNDGDTSYAKYIFDVLNEAGQKGLNIFFLFGHDHSNGWDDYLGGASVYLPKGDSILIAQNSRNDFKTEKLEFTYMNAGYTGYYNNHNGADDTLTMSVFRIEEDKVTVSRYSADGLHELKSGGVRNSYKNESGYEVNTDTYASPCEVLLTPVSDRTHLSDVIAPPVPDGRCYRRVQSTDDITDGGRYLMVYNSTLVLPSIVTKSNGSSERVGCDLKSVSGFETAYEFGSYHGDEWILNRTDSGWTLESENKYLQFIPNGGKIEARLTGTADVFDVQDAGTSLFTFGCGDNYLNYNSRGLINGYAGLSNAAKISLYEYVYVQLEKPEIQLLDKTQDALSIKWSAANEDGGLDKNIKYSVFISETPITEDSLDELTPSVSGYGMSSCIIDSLACDTDYYVAVTAANSEKDTVSAVAPGAFRTENDRNAAAVEKMISDLGEITSLDQKEAVEAARAAFNKLTETQQGLVKNENVLKDAEAAIEKLENPDKPVIKGDVDDNGTVNVSDIMTLKNLIMSSSWTPEQLERGDMNDDGTLTVGDMLSIKSIIMAG